MAIPITTRHFGQRYAMYHPAKYWIRTNSVRWFPFTHSSTVLHHPTHGNVNNAGRCQNSQLQSAWQKTWIFYLRTLRIYTKAKYDIIQEIKLLQSKSFCNIRSPYWLRKFMPSIVATNEIDRMSSFICTMYRTVRSNIKLIFDNIGEERITAIMQNNICKLPTLYEKITKN